jgi:molecular chaperone HtpG
MSERHGSLSINSENIFPIIKKWLYSDHDIFFRELISNGCDAITKLKKLEMMGEYTFPENYKNKIQVLVNPEEKTLKFIDTGLGMDADEVEEYINQIAFSGATDFLAKYKDKTNEDQIIGHFGLGFYSAFMVADEVHIDTLSYKEGATPVHWECDGGTEFSMTDGDKAEVGTTITLFLNEESVEFANEYRAREVIQKYCSFMPTEIYLSKEGEEVKEGEEPASLSDTAPLWTKHPNECEKEQYLEFYRKVFHDYKEPLFWIHLNMDYPFNLKGILYFPKINTEYDSIEGTIKLYNNQVFIADNIKEVIPEFLMLLKGVIDCPDLPLNVSRSALQNDGFVKKISDYITKKVADRLSGMCKTQRDDYENYWDDINPFIKFGCIKDEKFSNKMMDYILYKDIDGKYMTLKDMLPEEAEAEVVEDGKEEKKPTTVFYVTDELQQSQYINMFRAEGKNAVILRHNIDGAFVTHVERANETVHFQRIDADLTDDFKETVSEEEMKETADALTELFRKALDNENLQVKVEKLKNEEVSSMITLSEESRRMQEMMRMYGMPGMDPSMFGGDETLVLNANNQLVQYVLANKDAENTNLFCEQLYDLAMISHKPLAPEAMTKFIARSNQIMMMLAK